MHFSSQPSSHILHPNYPSCVLFHRVSASRDAIVLEMKVSGSVCSRGSGDFGTMLLQWGGCSQVISERDNFLGSLEASQHGRQGTLFRTGEILPRYDQGDAFWPNASFELVLTMRTEIWSHGSPGLLSVHF